MGAQDIQVSDVRRKLLKAAVYAPPVILGSMVATPRMAIGDTFGQPQTCKMNGGLPPVQIVISSGTNACCPCVPNSQKWDPVKCGEKQCINSCGANCSPGQIATIKCKKFCKICGFTPAGCKKPCKKGCFPDPKKPGKYKCK